MGRPSLAAISPDPMCVRCTKFIGSPIIVRSIRLLFFFGCGFSTTQQPSLCQKSLIFAEASSFSFFPPLLVAPLPDVVKALRPPASLPLELGGFTPKRNGSPGPALSHSMETLVSGRKSQGKMGEGHFPFSSQGRVSLFRSPALATPSPSRSPIPAGLSPPLARLSVPEKEEETFLGNFNPCPRCGTQRYKTGGDRTLYWSG